jgi:hypothetical protein
MTALVTRPGSSSASAASSGPGPSATSPTSSSATSRLLDALRRTSLQAFAVHRTTQARSCSGPLNGSRRQTSLQSTSWLTSRASSSDPR